MFKRKSLIFITILVLLTTLAIGCSNQEAPEEVKQEVKDTSSKYPLTITDGIGNETVINKKPERIVSLVPSHTEILFGLGLGEKVVGVTTYCDYPEEAKEKPVVGDSFTLNMEKIIELGPDLIINYWPVEDSVKEQLEAAGITLVTYSPESIEDVKETIEQIGIITDAEAEAEKLITDMQNKEEEILNVVKGADKVKVFYEIEYSTSLWTTGKGSFIDELITLSGGENIASDAEGAYTQYSVEALIEKNPEVYVTNTFNIEEVLEESIKDRPGFQGINAIKNDRIEILDGNILSRPSQRVVEALELMAKAIHPELFK